MTAANFEKAARAAVWLCNGLCGDGRKANIICV